ncbi:hypothetical protein ACFC1L_39855 [Streptomyces sp. NPDC056210]|uniref:hypothetical protein n=1 Tax=Streptomyces sp. NPDC056210 TaxID=3345746 RepID=UPI0035E124EE
MDMIVLETYFDQAECDADWDKFAMMVKTWANPTRWGIRKDNISDEYAQAWRLVLIDREGGDE